MILRRAVISLCAMGALVLLGACAVLAPRDAGPRSLPFDVLGRVLVSYDGRSFSSNVRWQHGPADDEVWMMTPTGQTLAHLRQDSSGAAITGTDQSTYRGADVESLTMQALGWEFPLTRLQHWLRAAPAPHVAVDITERDSNGRIVRMTQDGWRIGYEYSSAPGYDGLPRRVDVTGLTQNIRMVIDSWQREMQAGESNEGSQGFTVTK